MTIGVHQSNFAPWMPFFLKMAACDVFVILGDCQFSREGFQHRFSYRGEWMTMSVVRGHLSDRIRQKRYASPAQDWGRIKSRVGKPLLDEMDGLVEESLLQTNTAIIRHLAGRLGIRTPVVPDFETGLAGTERLVCLCRHFGARAYLAGRSGASYMDMKLFDEAGIAVKHQKVAPGEERHVLDALA